MAEQPQFFRTLLFHRGEMLLMGFTQPCEKADGGTDNRLQYIHLARLGNAGLKKGQLVVWGK